MQTETSTDVILRQPSVSVIVPVYNGEKTLLELVTQVHYTLESKGIVHEIVLVDDGSADESWNQIRHLSSQHAYARGITLARNFGQQNAILCGIRAAICDQIVTIDDDLQNPPSEILKLLSKLNDGFDLVYGIPNSLHHGKMRNYASTVTKFVIERGSDVKHLQSLSAFRAFDSKLRQGFENYKHPVVSVDYLLSTVTSKIGSIPVEHHPRKVGESNYTFYKLLLHAINMVTNFTVLPLRLATLNGFACIFIGVLLLILVFVRYWQNGGSVPGFPFLASVVIIFSGAQLMALGVIGEYLAQIHLLTMGKPQYLIKENTEPQLQQTQLK